MYELFRNPREPTKSPKVYKRRRTPEELDRARKGYWLKSIHKITILEWEAMFRRQGYACAICKTYTPRNKKGWHTDHDHKTRKFRGVLCPSCNILLGHVERSELDTEQLLK